MFDKGLQMLPNQVMTQMGMGKHQPKSTGMSKQSNNIGMNLAQQGMNMAGNMIGGMMGQGKQQPNKNMNITQQSSNKGIHNNQGYVIPQMCMQQPMGMGTAQQGMNMGIAQQGMNMANNMMGGMMGQVDPMAMARFNALDSDHSGSITVEEIQKAYQQFKFSAQSAKLLLQAVSDKTFIDAQTFPIFDQYIMSFYNIFMQCSMGQQTVQAPQVQQAVMMLNFKVEQSTLTDLIQKYDTDKNGLEFGEFISICAYLLITYKLMTKFDQKKAGVLTLDMNSLQALCLLFL
ncbi:Programmed_cell death protein-like protein [Hexamita inflata]|uniref:Programmed cell death protein-like protein n=1 Tax=Hexamita inflata TaxID=28002 RepID=A0AA86UR45_9EUKA|nr:Programmed cell death protein-like protein [Hexamita inflata]CAI9964749.1 Programmed cell death protein-like protein [Hexamita inflata]